MKINWIIPFTFNTGGIRVIFEHANGLKAKGHDVKIFMPIIPYLFSKNYTNPRDYWNWLKNLTRNFKNKDNINIDWFDLDIPIQKIIKVNDKNIPEADVIIATAWPTAFSVIKLSKNKGKKFYFIQGYETWSGPKNKVDETWDFPNVQKIGIASWMKKKNKDVLGPITNGIDLKQFYCDDKTFHDNPVIGMVYSPLKIKGIEDGIMAFVKAREKFPDIKLHFMGIAKDDKVPENDKFYKNPSPEQIREFYCGCDIFISPSWQEGCQLPPMEAMACKCALIATNVGGVPDYTIPGETALISEPKNTGALTDNLMKLLDNHEKIKHFSRAGHEHIRLFTWDRAADQLEKILQDGK